MAEHEYMGSAEYIEEQQLQKGSDFHSPTTYLDPPYQRKPPTAHILRQFLNFIMFYTIQIIYFLKAGDTHYPLIMNHSDDVDISQYCSSTGPSVSRFGIFMYVWMYVSMCKANTISDGFHSTQHVLYF